jgi:hypothetical protein
MATAPQSLKGEWTYRSFVNEPKPVGGDAQAALALIFGEGALTIVAADTSGFKGALSFGGKAVMDLVGSFKPAGAGAPAVIAARGTGRKGSGIEALVGTVMRAADHGSAKKGAVVSAIAVRR